MKDVEDLFNQGWEQGYLKGYDVGFGIGFKDGQEHNGGEPPRTAQESGQVSESQ